MLRLDVPEGRERILLHCCCAPCSGAVVECLVQNGLRPALFFSNSNIIPKEEYDLRRGELERYARSFGLEVVDDEYDHDAWLEYVLRDKSLAESPERGPRCLECFRFRLLRAARYAAANGYDLLTTTLASSRWKSLDQVNAAGLWACQMVSETALSSDQRDVWRPQADRRGSEALRGEPSPRPLGVQRDNSTLRKQRPEKDAPVLFWPINWRKGGLQPRRSEIICEQQFYNQTYCGCEFSEHHDAK